MSTWETILGDVESGLKALDGIINEGAALGLVPDAALVVPLVNLAQTVAAKLDALSKGDLTPIAAAVATVDAAVAAQVAAKWPQGDT
jgi:hypothetical protein